MNIKGWDIVNVNDTKSYRPSQEMSEMLANNLTVEDEEAVQEELLAMQKDVVQEEALPSIELPSVPTEPITKTEQGTQALVFMNLFNLGEQCRGRSMIE